MARQIRITGGHRSQLLSDARAAPKVIDNWVTFVQECIRWRLPLATVLDGFKLNKPLRKRIRQDSAAATQFDPINGLSVRMNSGPMWIELTVAELTNNIPNAWGAPRVITDPGDPFADPPVPPTTRRRRWEELPDIGRILIERPTDRWFTPASDGERYFSIDKLQALGLTEIEPEDIPAAPDPGP